MTSSSVFLATGGKDVSECLRAARRQSGGAVILAAVDFSRHSRAALAYACELADKLSAAIVALHVVHDPGEMPGYYAKLIKKKRLGRIEDTAAEAFDEFMAGMIRAHPKLDSLREAQRLMIVGLPVSRIVEVADIIQPMMLVVGSQGRTRMKQMIIGSKAAQILQLCPVPVTVVKNRKHADDE